MMLNIDLEKTEQGFRLQVSTNLLLPMLWMTLASASLPSIIQIALQAYEIWGK